MTTAARAIEDYTARCLLSQVGEAGLPEPTREYRFHPTRKWMFDFCWPDYSIAVEVEGGAWTRGRHTRGKGFIDDMVKYNEAALLKYTILRFTPEQVQAGEAMPYITEAFRQKGLR